MSEQNLEIERVEEEAEAKPSRPEPTLTPRFDIIELEESVILYVDMPGVDESGIDLLLEKQILSIKGEVQAGLLEGYEPVYTEYASGSYKRSVSLSEEIDQDGITATVRHGLLTLRLPKKEGAKTRKIVVNSA